MSAKKKTGRPSKFNQATARKILDRIAAGSSLTAACKLPGMPSEVSFRRWLASDELRVEYARACELRAEKYAADIVEIADTCTDPNKARLQIDARKWTASKLLPKKYGDKLDVEHGGSVSMEMVIGGDNA